MKRSLLLIIISILLLAGCSFSASNKPSDISQDVWDKTQQYVILVKDSVDSDILAIETSIPDKMANFRDEYFKKDLTDSETEIIENLMELGISWVELGVYDTGASQKSFDSNYEKLEEYFGDKNLDVDNLDLSVINIENQNELYQASDNTSANTTVEDLMEEKGVSLSNTDIQYDMANNLEEEFAIVGIAELTDYYNYGFTNEEDYFVARVTPDNGNSSDSWHLYFKRESFGDLYEMLRAGSQRIGAVAMIPESAYRSGQGNMAGVLFGGVIE